MTDPVIKKYHFTTTAYSGFRVRSTVWTKIENDSSRVLVDHLNTTASRGLGEWYATVSNGSQTPADVFIGQYVPDENPLIPGLVLGSFRMAMSVSNMSTTRNRHLRVIGRVMNSDLTVEKAVLFDTMSLSHNLSTDYVVTLSAPITPTMIGSGDRLLFDVGVHFPAVETHLMQAMRLRNLPAAWDGPELPYVSGASMSGNGNPWIELTFDPPPEPPALEFEATSDSITVSWPDAPLNTDSYGVSIDSETPVVIPRGETHTFTGLNHSTKYTFTSTSFIGPYESLPSSFEVYTDELPWVPPIEWGKTTDRLYMTGIDRGVLYLPGRDAVPWNGITNVEETGTGERTALYRDGRLYLAEVEPGDYEGSLTAYFFPDEFSECVGIPEIASGFYADNQKPQRFGLCYRSLIGNGSSGDMFGYQIHLVYNALAVIGSRSHNTVNDSPELEEFTFDLTATPIKLPRIRPTAHYIIDTRNLSPEHLAQIEGIIYGDGSYKARMPTPAELYELLMFRGAISIVDHGDGTWTASGSDIQMTGEHTWVIRNVDGTDHGDGTYTIRDTT